MREAEPAAEGAGAKPAREHDATIQELALHEICAGGRVAGERILDVGAGKGWLAQELARRGARVTVLDLEARVAGRRIDAVVHHLDEPRLPFADAAFDVVVATEVFEHLRAPFLVLHHMVRVLKKGGRLVLSIPNYWNVRHRLRYLLSGNLQRVALDDRRVAAWYRRGYAPHLNALSWPTLKAVLTWEGCERFHLRSRRLLAWHQRLFFLPWLALIGAADRVASRERRARQLLDETNAPGVLLGAGQIVVTCTKTGRR